MEHILLPNKIDFSATDQPNTGTVVIMPCQQGYGTTLANALRRVLLSSLPGSAAESVKIKGVDHEFATIDGVQEDVVEILLNLKQLSVKCHSDQPVTLSLKKKGVGPVTAGDLEKNADVEIANPDLLIATITDKTIELEMDVTVGQGFGYVPVVEKNTKDYDLGTIAIDSLYTPIRDVGYSVDMTRLGDVTDYEKLSLTIETDGTITPKEAVGQATKILMDYFTLISDSADNGVEATPAIKEETEEPAEKEDEIVEDKKEKESKDDAKEETEEDKK